MNFPPRIVALEEVNISFHHLADGHQRHRAEEWTEIRSSSSLQGFMKAYVQGKEEEAIVLPFTQQRGDFNLAYKNNYKDFKFYLDSALLDRNEANVVFDVYVDLEGE